MFKSRVIRLIGLVATLTVAAVSLHTATAGAAVPEYKLNFLDAGTCYLPHDVAYGGIPAYIGASGFKVENTGSTLVAREFLIVVDYNTGKWVKSRWVGDYTLPARTVTTFPAASTDLSFRNTLPFFWATLRVELDVYSNGALVGILAGVPSSFRIWDNSGFVTYHDTGRNQAYC